MPGGGSREPLTLQILPDLLFTCQFSSFVVPLDSVNHTETFLSFVTLAHLGGHAVLLHLLLPSLTLAPGIQQLFTEHLLCVAGAGAGDQGRTTQPRHALTQGVG